MQIKALDYLVPSLSWLHKTAVLFHTALKYTELPAIQLWQSCNNRQYKQRNLSTLRSCDKGPAKARGGEVSRSARCWCNQGLTASERLLARRHDLVTLHKLRVKTETEIWQHPINKKNKNPCWNELASTQFGSVRLEELVIRGSSVKHQPEEDRPHRQSIQAGRCAVRVGAAAEVISNGIEKTKQEKQNSSAKYCISQLVLVSLL